MCESWKKKLLVLLLSGILVSLYGCGKKEEKPDSFLKIDTTTEETTKQSLEHALNQLNKDDQTKFKKAYDSLINYAYAKTHEGRITDFNSNISFEYVPRLNTEEELKAASEMKAIRNKILNGITYPELLEAQQVFDQKTDELIEERKKLLLQQAKEDAELRAKKKERFKELAILQEGKEIEKNISDIRKDITAKDKELRSVYEMLDPYQKAEDAYRNTVIENVRFYPSEDKRDWFIGLDLTNNNDVDLIDYEFKILLDTNMGKEATISFVSYGKDRVIPAHRSKSMHEEIPGKYTKELTIDSKVIYYPKLISVTIVLDDKEYKAFSYENGGAKIPKKILNDMNKIKAEKDLLEQKAAGEQHRLDSFNDRFKEAPLDVQKEEQSASQQP